MPSAAWSRAAPTGAAAAAAATVTRRRRSCSGWRARRPGRLGWLGLKLAARRPGATALALLALLLLGWLCVAVYREVLPVMTLRGHVRGFVWWARWTAYERLLAPLQPRYLPPPEFRPPVWVIGLDPATSWQTGLRREAFTRWHRELGVPADVMQHFEAIDGVTAYNLTARCSPRLKCGGRSNLTAAVAPEATSCVCEHGSAEVDLLF